MSYECDNDSHEIGCLCPGYQPPEVVLKIEKGHSDDIGKNGYEVWFYGRRFALTTPVRQNWTYEPYGQLGYARQYGRERINIEFEMMPWPEPPKDLSIPPNIVLGDN